jgi:phosphate ABC transporter phosphate-binding protein
MLKLAKGVAVAVLAVGATMVSAETKLQGKGATFPAPVYKEWIKEYQKSHSDVQIDYQAAGSGAGITGITDRTVDFAGSDAPMNKDELAKATANGEVVQFPSIAGGVAIAYNIPGFSGDLKLSGPVVADIYLGTITKWNDPRIASENPGASLPDQAIVPIARGDKSGTTFVFTSYLATQSPDSKDVIGVGKSGNWPVGQKGEKSDGVTSLIKDTKGAIGYIEQNYAAKNHLQTASLKNKAGKYVKPTTEAVSSAAAAAASKMTAGLTADIWNQDAAEAYPIASFSYVMIYKDLAYTKDEAKAKALVDFWKWALTDGQKMAGGLDYAPVGDEVSKKVGEALNSLTYSGKPVK